VFRYFISFDLKKSHFLLIKQKKQIKIWTKKIRKQNTKRTEECIKYTTLSTNKKLRIGPV
jgi:hypothetical protein